MRVSRFVAANAQRWQIPNTMCTAFSPVRAYVLFRYPIELNLHFAVGKE